MAIVSCPECSKKLKVADTSVGKKVKCSCGNVFVATESNGAPAAPAAASDKVMVACTECGAKLKVAATSLGKKMKCPKCAGVFVAAVEDEEPPPPPKKAAKLAPEPEEDEEAPAPKKKGKPANDDMDDFFSFAEKDAAGHADDEDDVKPKGKAKKAEPEDDEEEIPDWRKGKSDDLDDTIEEDDAPRPKAKAGKKGPPPRPTVDDDEPAEKPKYPRRTFLNLLVLFLLILFIAGFAVVLLGIVPLGLPTPKIVPRKTDQAKKLEDAEKRNKEAIANLEGTWIVESAEWQGQPEPARKGQRVVFAEGKFTGPDVTAAPFSVDATYDPMRLDMVLPEKAGVAGIYKIDGDKLEMCLKQSKKNNQEPLEHPNAFDSKAGLLLVLKRGKADDKGAEKDKVKDKDKDKAKEKGKTPNGAAKLDGTWVIESALAGGKPEERSVGEPLTFADGKVTGMGPGTVPYKADFTKDPHWLDVTVSFGKDKTMTMAGIFKFDGDKLVICVPPPDGPRPASFGANGAFVATLRRAGKDDGKISKNQSVINLKQIGLAIHNYHDSNRGLPPAASSGANDPTGKPLLSWRVAILPSLDEIELYKQFDLNKPWDDPHNMKLIAKMPKIYMAPGVDAKPGMTHYRTLVGPGTPLDPQKSKTGKLVAKYTLANMPDGISNVIMVVEAKEATIWTKPDDLPYDPKGPLPKFGVSPAGFNALFADGSVRFVSSKVPEAVLRTWLTCNNATPRQPLEPTKGAGKDKGLDLEKPKVKSKDKDLDKEKSKLKGPDDPVDPAKTAAARTQIQVLTRAVQAYALKNDGKFPTSLNALLEKDDKGNGPYLEKRDALMDPWKGFYLYDLSGRHNNGKHPDIWTESPSKERIGNWQKVKADKK